MIVFHASTVPIDEFYILYGGLHFGGVHSAIKCALQKLYEGRSEGHDIENIYIHKCFLTGTKFHESKDMGSDSGWRSLNNTLIQQMSDFEIIKYINEYELDVVPSYCVFNTRYIKLLECSEMHMDTAEDILCGKNNDEFRYVY